MKKKQFYNELQKMGYSKDFCNKIKHQYQDEMRVLYFELIYKNSQLYNEYCRLFKIENVDCI